MAPLPRPMFFLSFSWYQRLSFLWIYQIVQKINQTNLKTKFLKVAPLQQPVNCGPLVVVGDNIAEMLSSTLVKQANLNAFRHNKLSKYGGDGITVECGGSELVRVNLRILNVCVGCGIVLAREIFGKNIEKIEKKKFGNLIH